MINKLANSAILQYRDAILVVDVQNDFLPTGSLPVNDGDKIIAPLNAYIETFALLYLPIFITMDWHPPNHSSFKENGGVWPVHCVAGTNGAELSRELDVHTLDIKRPARIFPKGESIDKDAYSGFEDTDLDEELQKWSVKRLFIGGLATDYCVLNTVKDALKLGYEVCLLGDAIKAVNIHSEDGVKAVQEMSDLGAILI